MRYLFSHCLLSLCALFVAATAGYAIAISPSEGSQELLSTTTPNSAFNSFIKGTNPFNALFVDYERARKEASELGFFLYPQITIWEPSDKLPGSGYTKTYKTVGKELPANPSTAFLEADHLLEVQVLAKLLKAAGVTHSASNPAFSNDVIAAIKDLMNGGENVRYIPMELNAFKGRAINAVLKDVIKSNGKCSILQVDPWREDMMRSLFSYLHFNCVKIMTTAIAVEEKLSKARPATEPQRKWLAVSRMMEAVLFCLHVQVHWDEDGEPEVSSCDVFS